MSKINVEFHRLALKEFDEARAWYAASSPGTALRVKAAVEETIKPHCREAGTFRPHIQPLSLGTSA